MLEDSYDYVVIGGGSSGCIAAARLAEAGIGSVLLLEAGDRAETHPETLTADGFKFAFANDSLMWHRMSTAQPACGNRPLYAGTGRGMGGSGSVNGMVYTRGDRRDFVRWPHGWQWDDLAPVFDAVEQRLRIRPRAPTPFAERYITASLSAGFRRKDGLNDGDLGGFVGCNDMNYEGDERRSAYRAFIKENHPPTLSIVTNAPVERLLLDEHNAVIGVVCRHENREHRISVRCETLLCAGALETPKLLMLSGIGPRDELQKHGIDVCVDAAGVGCELQDHPNVCLFFKTRAPVDFAYPQVYGFDAARRKAGEASDAAPDTCFVCYAAPASIKQSMLRMLPILALPGALHAITLLRKLLRGLIHLAFALPPLRAFVSNIFGMVVILGKPLSRGTIRLRSKNPCDAADIDLAYYRAPQDRETLLAGIAKACDIAQQPALQQAGTTLLSKDAASSDAKRRWKWATTATMTTFHFCGSCRMGEDAASPVDLQLRVKGVKRLRVADASVIPEIPVSALNAPSMMVGYRAADFILAGASA